MTSPAVQVRIQKLVGGEGFEPSASRSRTVRAKGCWHPGRAGGAHARIRTGDLFLTKWSSIPGEFESILAPAARFRPRPFNWPSLARRSKQGSSHHPKSHHSHEDSDNRTKRRPGGGIRRPRQVQEFVQVRAVSVDPVVPLLAQDADVSEYGNAHAASNQSTDNEIDLSRPVWHHMSLQRMGTHFAQRTHRLVPNRRLRPTVFGSILAQPHHLAESLLTRTPCQGLV